VARRIQLPSSDELFGDTPKKPSPKAAPKKTSTSRNAPKAAAKTRQTAARGTSAGAPRATRNSSLHRDASSREVESARIDAVEARLTSLPIDSLMDLRDGLEDILAAGTLDEAAVRELLDNLGA